MANPEIEKLLAEYAFGTLDDADRDRLFRAAHEDRELFAQLAEQERLRAVLNDEPFREELRRALNRAEEPASRWDRMFAWLRTPVGMGIFGLAAAALAAFLLLPRGGGLRTETTIQAARRPAAPQLLAMVRDLPISKGLLFTQLELNQAEYQPGDRIRIAFTLDRAANVVLLEQRADGEVITLFPNIYTASPRVEAGQRITIPPVGQEFAVDGRAGRRRLRLLVFPADVDPLAPDFDYAAVAERVDTVEKEFLVR